MDAKEPIRLLLVWPGVQGSQLHGFLPLGLAALAANLPAGCEVRLWDGVLTRQPNRCVAEELDRFRPDVVGLSVWHFNLLGAREIVATVRERLPDTILVAGGPTVCGYRDGVFDLLDVDYAIMGEGERSFAKFMALLRDGQLTPQAKAEIPGLIFRDESGRAMSNPVSWDPLDDLKGWDYERIRLGDYLDRGYYYGMHPKARRTAPIFTTRGCPFPCEFCSARLINGTVVRTRPVASVVAEVAQLYEKFGIRGFNIIDDNFTFHQDYAKEVCRALLGLKLQGVSFCAPNGVKLEHLDQELLELMKQVGWHTLYIAPESGSERTLKRMRKTVDLPVVREKLRLIKSVGLKVFGFFIIGYPGETVEDIRMTFDFACRNPFDWAAFTCFQPLAGTPICERLVAEGEIPRAPEGVDCYQVTYAPKGLTVRQLKRLRFWGYLRFYTSSFVRFRSALSSYSWRRILVFLRKLR